MKELTIEEKAQRYDEAIEKLRGFYRDYDTVSRLIDVKEELANLIPELREVEDEEVRKAMIDFFKHEREEGIAVLHYGVNVERMIAWLEKRGEQKPTWSGEDKRKMDRIYSILRQAADTHAFSTTCRLIGDTECIELQDFLKSLKDRVGCEANCTTMWKPSAEQMRALSDISITGCVSYAGQGQALTDLYNDLTKLKGE